MLEVFHFTFNMSFPWQKKKKRGALGGVGGLLIGFRIRLAILAVL